MMEILKVKPHFVKKIWGGSISEQWYGHTSSSLPIGEVWGVYANDDFSNGLQDYQQSLVTWLKDHPDRYPMKTAQLPFRVSIIDAKEDLSVQVHPTDEYAKKYGLASGLDEAWVVLQTKPQSALQIGHHASTKHMLSDLVYSGKFDTLLRYQDVSAMDAFYIPAGTIHAIGHDMLVYEISQAVDQTFRVYDYDRIDQTTMQKRDLHIKQALEVITTPDRNDHKLKKTWEVGVAFDYRAVLRSSHFNLDQYVIKAPTKLTLRNWGFISVVGGQGIINGLHVSIGDTILISLQEKKIEVTGNLSIIFASIGEQYER